MEQFYTIQGEGAFSGHAAYFIRLGGCDVGCVWCDVKESWDAAIHPQVPIDELVNEAAKNPSKTVVITGGEPLMHNLTSLVLHLQKKGCRVHIETSGAHALHGEAFDWITVSPKKFKPPVDDVLLKADELKIVVFNKSDFDWAQLHATKVSAKCRLYLQPEWDKRNEMMPLIVEYVKVHPQWNISLQTHKYLQIP
ncbi:MAG: 7-carboxy-7-deazaguanine synthase QueE [Bacteroidia bacterium]|nr:7-carboxy-7-deazaguanine synthase QueE [Bacteroidia bacterium]